MTSRFRSYLQYVLPTSSSRTTRRQSRLAAGMLAIVALFTLWMTPLMQAQLTTGSLSGTVRDASGAVVANAKVTLLHDATSDLRSTVSNASGHFTFAAVQPGSYTVTVEASGFSLWKQTGIVPAGAWYVEAATGMGQTLTVASEKRAYTLSDRGTFVARQGQDQVTRGLPA